MILPDIPVFVQVLWLWHYLYVYKNGTDYTTAGCVGNTREEYRYINTECDRC